MNNIKYYIEFLKEGKNVGILYHFTNDESILSILEDDILKSNGNDYTSLNAVSLTRDKHFHKNKYRSIDNSFRIVLDGNKLSNKYKIIPHQDAFEPMIQDYIWKGHPNRRLYFESESEEKIESDIYNITNYIIEINYHKTFYRNSLKLELEREYFNSIQELCSEKGIIFRKYD